MATGEPNWWYDQIKNRGIFDKDSSFMNEVLQQPLLTQSPYGTAEAGIDQAVAPSYGECIAPIKMEWHNPMDAEMEQLKAEIERMKIELSTVVSLNMNEMAKTLVDVQPMSGDLVEGIMKMDVKLDIDTPETAYDRAMKGL